MSTDEKAALAQQAVPGIDEAKRSVLQLMAMSGSWGDPAHLQDRPGDTLLIKRVRELLRAIAKADAGQ